MKIYQTVLWIVSLCAGVCAKFSYERGSCDVSIFSVLQDMFHNEMRALVNPSLRYSNKKQIQYDLYTPYNPTKRQILKTGDTVGLRQSYFNAKWPVRISIHGWTGKSTSCSNAAIKDAYLQRGNFNVIIVDWSAHSLDISYSRISRQFQAIAENFAKFVNFLHRQTGIAYENMYVIGHSAGSHIAGLTGKLIKPNRFGVIYAIDPAGLNQLGASEKHRIAPSDAIYVESIHTDITLLGNPTTELSHASFFVNWGQGQPQCPNATATEFQFACDHFSALYYFVESIRNPKMFGALHCNTKKYAASPSASPSASASAFETAATATTTSASAVDGSASTTATTSPANHIAQFDCGCRNGNDACKAEVYMGGEPAVPKIGVFYLSTEPRPPYGYGSEVHMRNPRNPTFLQSTLLTERDTTKYLFRLLTWRPETVVSF